ncbi:MAG: SAM-dependent methyltransferase [Pseudomonadales bacterium]|nr:SAM-dependent methyltransferase [Pseudomonadales bacterium]
MNLAAPPQQTESVSRNVQSSQAGVHENLTQLVKKHLRTRSSRPYATHNLQAFEALMQAADGRELILDSGCGTGSRTATLAKRHPRALVAGIDKSAKRLAGPAQAIKTTGNGNAIFLRADLFDFFRIAASQGTRLHKHYILYPNPWPKPGHLQRRWHGSAVFRDIVELGGEIELRSNWRVYVEEFSVALDIAGINCTVEQLKPDDADTLTPFEKKYHRSGHDLWVLKT